MLQDIRFAVRSLSRNPMFGNSVGPRYFSTLEMPLVAGREIGMQDGRGAPGAAVINETLARQLWPGADALGRTRRLDGNTLEVVGVARAAKRMNPEHLNPGAPTC
jgi:hypothetical protein